MTERPRVSLEGYEVTDVLMNALGPFENEVDAANWAKEGNRILRNMGVQNYFIGPVDIGGTLVNVVKKQEVRRLGRG